MRLVMKFGGVSVEGGDRILHSASVANKFIDHNKAVIVVSAMGGVTDKLYEVAYRALRVKRIRGLVDEMRRRHLAALDKIGKHVEQTRRELDNLFQELENALLGIHYLGDVSPQSLDYVVSFGERLMAPIFSAALRSLGRRSVHLSGGDAGLITDDKFGDASPLPSSYARIRRKIIPMLRDGITPVVTGFIGRTRDGRITTLGRGGSDYSATIIGAAIDADEVWFWKETDGVMSADPKIVPNARTVPQLSYMEAMELSYFGAKVLHPKAIQPVMEKGIPVVVKNVFNPNGIGTRIHRENDGRAVKAVSLIRNVAMLDIFGPVMVDTPGSAGKVFTTLGGAGVNVIMIAQASSENSISVIVDRKSAKTAIDAIKREFRRRIMVIPDERVCIVSVVGSGMKGTPGIAGRIFSTVGREGINVRMIAQGPSEFNVSFVVDEKDGERAVRAVHREFLE